MKKADLKVGFSCNNHCRFCVQGDKRTKFGDKDTERIKKEMEEAVKDCQGIVLTGGEVTLRSDFLELVRYAKKVGFKAIQVQTNGRMFAYPDFCKKTIKAGANEFSPALHGHNGELHDYLTRAEGSFEQTVQGIKNLKALNQKVITNTVVTRSNYRHLPEIAELLVSLRVDQYQFAFVHALGSAKENFKEVVPRFELVEPYIKKGLDVGIKTNTSVMTEAIPFCFMKGYENYVAEQVIPDTKIFDANDIVENFTKARQTQGKKKADKCKKCDYFEKCEGPWKEYPEEFGWDEFDPVNKNSTKKSIRNLFNYLILI